MSRARAGATAVAAVASVAARRAARGPLHPGWSFRYEVANAFLKRTMRRIARLDWPGQRAAWDALAMEGPALRKCAREPAATGTGVKAEWIVSPGAGPAAPVLVWLHGGGFVYGSVRTHGEMIAAAAIAAGARALAPEYRLAPEHPFPAALDDALAAYRSVLSSGVPASRVVLAGDSSGGNLALAALVRARDEGLPLPAAGVLVCPWVDLEERAGSVVTNARYDWADPWMFDAWAEAYLGYRSRRLPLAAPIHADLQGLPPLLLQAGGAEMNRDQVLRLADRARAAGVDVTLRVHEAMTHDWHALAAQLPELGAGIEEIGAFVAERCGAAGSGATVAAR
jgi:monoterpene epsilon-lactone hydrolase